MPTIEQGLALAAALLLAAIVASTASMRLGLPILLVFLAVGMVARALGLLPPTLVVAYGVGAVALAIILFDGGLRTPWSAFRQAWRPALSLATLGVVITAGAVAAIAVWGFGLSPLAGWLLGSLVGSTDAAAVFALLRTRGVHLPPRTAAILEIESGANDPMAAFLTIAFLEALLGRAATPAAWAELFVRQMGIGAAAGLLGGVGLAAMLNRLRLPTAGLYPVLANAGALLVFGGTMALHGSGFLAVYLAGLVAGNRRVVFKRGILLVQGGLAWLAQVVMFVALGLLADPQRLRAILGPGVALAVALVLVARPLATFLTLLPFRVSLREILLIAWTGLRGATPIVLALFPLAAGAPHGELLFHLVFFAVLLSAATQGWTLPLVARALGLAQPAPPAPPVSLEILSLRHVDADIVEYTIGPESRAAHKQLRDLALPDGAVVAMVVRGASILAPRGATRLRPGDHVFVVLRLDVRDQVDAVFAPVEEAREIRPEIVIAGEAPLEELAAWLGDEAAAELAGRGGTVGEWLRERLGEPVEEGAGAEWAGALVYVRKLDENGAIRQVGLVPGSATPRRPQPDRPNGHREHAGRGTQGNGGAGQAVVQVAGQAAGQGGVEGHAPQGADAEEREIERGGA